MSDGFDWCDQSTSSTNSLRYTGQSSHTNRRRQLPAQSSDDQFNFSGLGVETNYSALDQSVWTDQAAPPFDLSESITASYNEDIRVQPQTSPPWTALSARQAQGERPTPERSGHGWLTLPAELRETQQNYYAPAQVNLEQSAHANNLDAKDGTSWNFPQLYPNQPNAYPRRAHPADAYPRDVYSPTSSIRGAQASDVYLQQSRQAYPYGQNVGRPIDASSAWLPATNSSQTQQRSSRSQDLASLTFDRVAAQSRLPQQNPPNVSAGSLFGAQVPLNRTNLRQQQHQFPPTADYAASGESRRQVAIPRAPPSSSSGGSDNKHRCECEHCGQGFTREGDLDRHLRTLHGNTFYQCALCDHQNRRIDKMREHCRKHHGQLPGQEQFFQR